MTPVRRRAHAQGRRNELQVRFESPEVDGLQPGQDLHASSAATTPSASSTSSSTTAAAPVTPQLYLQLARDGNPPEGESSFYSTFTGPAMYTEAEQVPEDRLQGHREGQGRATTRRADNGWVAMVQHYFASAWLVAGNEPREFRTRKVGDNLYSIAMVLPLGEVAPGASKALRGDAVRRPAGGEQARRAGARARAGQGLRLVHHPVQAAVLAARPAARRARQLGLGDRRAGGAAEDRLLLAQRQRLPVDGQDEGHQPQGDGDARALQGQAAADAAGDDAHLPRGEGQPAGRLPADRRADAVLHRAVLGAAVQRGDAQRAVDRLDHRPVEPRTRTSSCRC